MEQMKINRLEIENVKRIKAVVIEPTANGLTIVGGKNRQGHIGNIMGTDQSYVSKLLKDACQKIYKESLK